jgi:predicted NBD/HSP70 family sugar kinase
VHTGEGLSVGLVLDGAVYRGPNGLAGELGHHTVDVNGDLCVCGLRGCWETIGNLAWLRREAKRVGLAQPDQLDCAGVTRRASDGDDRARQLLTRYAENLGIGLANVRQILGSGYFIIHGDAVGGGEPFRQAIEEAACRRALRPVEVVLTQLGDRATILGAVAVVLSEVLHLT